MTRLWRREEVVAGRWVGLLAVAVVATNALTWHLGKPTAVRATERSVAAEMNRTAIAASARRCVCGCPGCTAGRRP